MSADEVAFDPLQRGLLVKRIEAAYARADAESAASALGFLHHVVIDSRPEPRAFRLVAEPWQWALLGRIVPAIESSAGVRAVYDGPRSFWFTLPRGHDKSSSIARLSAWALAYCAKPLRAVAGAVDKEQANFIAEFMQAEAKLNPWLAARLEFKHHYVHGTKTGSKLRILAAEAYSSYGLKEDLIILDELTHWPKRELWDAVVSGRRKRPNCVIIVITNAGVVGSWQHEILLAAKESSDWYVYEAPHRLAGWMDAAKIDEDRRMLPPAVCRRVFDNQWISPGDDCGFVSKAEARRCVDPSLRRREKGDPETSYVAAVDYGVVKDRCVACVGHRTPGGKIVIDRMDVWQGSHANRVKVAAVEEWISTAARHFNRPRLVLDPYQMEGTAQKFEGLLETERFEARGGKANYEMAQNLRSLIVNDRLKWYPGCGDVVTAAGVHTLADEVGELIIRPMGYGWRMDHLPRNHDDRAVALGMMALTATRYEGRRFIKWNDAFF